MLNVKEINRYFVRLTALPERSDIVGQVIYLRHVSPKGIVISMTDDCRPLPQPIPLSPAANDNGWYDATELILDANCAITPRYDVCAFMNETARQYRNFIEDPAALRPCEGDAASNRLCFIGRDNGGRLELSKTAYFVVSMDNHGFYITYSGFCNPRKGMSPPKTVQRVIRLEGTGQRFFQAEPIVSACNASYKGDIALHQKYSEALRDKVAASSTSTTHAADPKRDVSNLVGMRLG